MIGFTFKKNFFDLWDNLFVVFLLNFILLLLIAGAFYIPMLLAFNTQLSILSLLIFLITIAVFLGGTMALTLNMSEYKNPDFSSFFSAIKKTYKASILFAVLFVIFVFISRIAIGYYISLVNTGTASYLYKLDSKKIDIDVSFVDKKGGYVAYSLFINEKLIHKWKSDRSKKDDLLISESIKNIDIKDGDKISIIGKFINGEMPILDQIIIRDSETQNTTIVEIEDAELQNFKAVDVDVANNKKGVTLYFSKKSMFGISISFFLILVTLSVFISMQYFFPIYLRLNRGFYKSLKLSFTIFFDNLGFSVAVFLISIAIMLFSMFFAYVAPGIAGVFLWINNALKLRLYKYDYISNNPTADKKKIPWDELLEKDIETIGPRSIKDLIFPWKY